MTSSTPRRSAGGHTTSSDTASSARPLSSTVYDSSSRLRPPRSLPPWIAPYDDRIGSIAEDHLRPLHPPAPSVQPHHNALPNEPRRRVSVDGFVVEEDPRLGPGKAALGAIPHFLRYGRAPMRGRKWDHLRTADPVIVSAPGLVPTKPTSSWGDFVKSSAWGHAPNEKSEILDIEAFNRLQPTFNDPVDFPRHLTEFKQDRRKRTLVKRLWNGALRGSFAPLVFRLVVIVTSIMALAIAVRIYQLQDIVTRDSAERTQSVVAVAVDCVAIPFNGYMIWDEYTGKPLGLRSARAKMSLILLDLFFIVFKSAGTALAFESVVYHGVDDDRTLGLSKAVAAFQLLGLLAWNMNFTVNIFRVVEKLGGGDGDGD